MRNFLNSFLGIRYLIAVVVVLLPCTLFAGGVDWSTPPNDLITQILTVVAAIPKFGPIISTAMYYVGGVSALFTALTVFVKSVLIIPQVVARFKGANELADKIEAVSVKVSFYLKYLSIFNAKK